MYEVKKGYVIYKLVDGKKQYFRGTYVWHYQTKCIWKAIEGNFFELNKLYKSKQGAEKAAEKLGGQIEEVEWLVDMYGDIQMRVAQNGVEGLNLL